MKSSKVWKLSFLSAAILLSHMGYAQISASAVAPAGSVPAGYLRPHVWIASNSGHPFVHGPGQTGATCSADGCYYVPSDVRTAYAIGSIPNGNGGAGITVGIVDAYYNAQTESDLAAFDEQFGLPTCTIANDCLTIVNQTGGAPSAELDSGWALETDLDVQWVHAIAPNAKILLITANTNAGTDLYAAVHYAIAHANVVTDSWGADEYGTETIILDPVLAGSTVPILFSAGDSTGVEYPCSSPYVTCVGGTSLLETATSFRSLESVWGGVAGDGSTGGGCSIEEAEPSYQNGFSDSACGSRRGIPDVAAIADPYTGALVFLGSNACSGEGPADDEHSCTANGFYEIGGTSLASPVIAAYIANVDSARAAISKAPLGSNLNQLLYTSVANPFYHFRFWDITVGSSTVPAAVGWDADTGLGVPLGPALSVFLVSQ